MGGIPTNKVFFTVSLKRIDSRPLPQEAKDFSAIVGPVLQALLAPFVIDNRTAGLLTTVFS
jgi:hypothetical protein